MSIQGNLLNKKYYLQNLIKMDDNIIIGLQKKSKTKQVVYRNTLNVFKEFKKALKNKCDFYSKKSEKIDDGISISFKAKGEFESELKFAGDTLVFQMHSNIFTFNKQHGIWKNNYVKNHPLNSYCGIISVYNFLSDSIKYNRQHDLGFLVGRIFVNREKHFFTDGQGQLNFLFNDFENEIISEENIEKIINCSIIYALEFDLVTPPYNEVQAVSIQQINNLNHSKTQTANRLGFKLKDEE